MGEYYANYGGFMTLMEHEMFNCCTSVKTDQNASLTKDQMCNSYKVLTVNKKGTWKTNDCSKGKKKQQTLQRSTIHM